MILPIIDAFLLAIGTVYERFILKKKGVNVNSFLVGMFFIIVLVMLPLIYFYWGVDAEAWKLKNIFILLVVILVSVAANVFAFYSLKNAKLNSTESARVIEPVFTIVLAVVFSFIFGTDLYERNFRVIIPAFIAAGALVFSHVKKHKIKMNKFYVATLVGSSLFALELVISKLILGFYNPISFYFMRSLGVFVFAFFIFKPKVSKFNPRFGWMVLFTAIIWVTFRGIMYYSYQTIGIVMTTLILMLGPILVYFFAHFFLKEKLDWKNIFASVVIIGCIVYVLVF